MTYSYQINSTVAALRDTMLPKLLSGKITTTPTS
jgi:hypothetical protein